MKFHIANKLVKYKYRGPIFITLLWPTIITLGALMLGEKIPFEPIFYVFCFSGFAAFLNIRGGNALRKYAEQHCLEITPAGMISHEPDTTTTMVWNNVKLIKVKRSARKIKSLKLITTNATGADLSRYEDLERLCGELEKYVAPEKWQYRGYVITFI